MASDVYEQQLDPDHVGATVPLPRQMVLSNIYIFFLRTNTRPASAAFATLGSKDRLQQHWVNFKNNSFSKNDLSKTTTIKRGSSS